MAALEVHLSRTSLSLPALVLSAEDDDRVWGIAPGFTPPARLARTIYAESPFTHGAVATGSTWQQAFINMDVFPNVATEAEFETALAELEDALAQFTYTAAIVLNGVTKVWRCDPGSITPSPMDFPQIRDRKRLHSVTIPCYPLAVS